MQHQSMQMTWHISHIDHSKEVGTLMSIFSFIQYLQSIVLLAWVFHPLVDALLFMEAILPWTWESKLTSSFSTNQLPSLPSHNKENDCRSLLAYHVPDSTYVIVAAPRTWSFQLLHRTSSCPSMMPLSQHSIIRIDCMVIGYGIDHGWNPNLALYVLWTVNLNIYAS